MSNAEVASNSSMEQISYIFLDISIAELGNIYVSYNINLEFFAQAKKNILIFWSSSHEKNANDEPKFCLLNFAFIALYG